MNYYFIICSVISAFFTRGMAAKEFFMKKICVVLMVLAVGAELMSCATVDREIRYATPEDIYGWAELGEQAFDNGDYIKAAGFYNRVVRADREKDVLTAPERVAVWTTYGACMTNIGQYSAAINLYNVALMYDPDDPIAQSNLALTRQLMAGQQQQTAVAAAAPQQQVDVSGLVDALNALGQSFQPQGGGQVAQAPNTPAPSTRDWQTAYNNNVRRLESAIGSYNRMTTTTARTGQLQTIRGYQRDMRDIRSQARTDGVTIAASPLENWNP
jgi:tetratricopeptide (TPR) repeat protein